MVDLPIPTIQRQPQEVPLAQDRLNVEARLPSNTPGDTVANIIDAGTKFFEQQLEASANDYAKDSYLQIRDAFNKGFNAGDGQNLGLRFIEGSEQFGVARNDLVKKLNQKKEEILSKDGLSNYARQKATEKIDEAMSTFQYYMDVQEGQVKIADRTKKTALLVQSKTEDLNNILGSNFNPESISSLKALGNGIKDIRNTIYDSMVDSGTASKTQDKDGNPKYIVSNVGQFEATKMMSKIVSDFTENIAAQPNGPEKAKAILDNYGEYILPATRTRIEKYIGQRAINNDAYAIVNELVNIKEATPDQYQAKVDELLANDQPELARKVQQLYPTALEKKHAVIRNLSKGYADTAYQMVIQNGWISLADAEQDPKFLNIYNKIEDATVKKGINSFFTPPKTSSLEAIEDMEKFLMTGSTDAKEFTKLLSPLNATDRKTYGTLFTGFGGTDTDKSKTIKTKAYLNESVKLLEEVSNVRYPDEDDQKIIADFKTKFVDAVSKEPSIPDLNTSAGRAYFNKFIEAYNNEDPLPVPNFKGVRTAPVNEKDVVINEKFYSKFGRLPSPAEVDYYKKNNMYKDLKTGQVK